MTALDRNVRQTQVRLGINVWLNAAGWCAVVAAAAWVMIVLADKLFGLQWPRLLLALGLGVLCLAVSGAWALLRRSDRIAAAAALDEAADLKERTSSGLYCLADRDPFARATVYDAEQANSRVTVRSYIKFCWPSSLSFATVALVVAGLVTLIPIRPLQAGDQTVARDDREEFLRTDVKRVKSRLQQLREQAGRSTALQEFEQQLSTIDDLPPEKLETPVSVRREAIKNLDQLADALRQKREEDAGKLQALKQMFRNLKAVEQPETPSRRLSQSLSKGDFRAAQDALKEMREQLAKLAEQQDPEQIKAMQEQVARLAKKLRDAARQQEEQQRLERELTKAGVDPETARRALENLTKADLQKMAEQMKKQGASEQQVQEMAKKLKANQQAAKQCDGLADGLQKAAESMSGSAALADAARQLQAAADQLNAMELLQQQVNELDSMIVDAQEMQNDMFQEQEGFCRQCSGQGCKKCGGMGPRPRQGRGGRAPEEHTDVRFKKVRTPVETTPGSIISKMFIEGEQVRGDISTQASELISAAEREATDALSEDQIPKQYHSAVKKYFSQLKREFQDAPAADPDAEDSGAEE